MKQENRNYSRKIAGSDRRVPEPLESWNGYLEYGPGSPLSLRTHPASLILMTPRAQGLSGRCIGAWCFAVFLPPCGVRRP
eukprot:scaffold27835_cov122-Isochrysis_galbana.AAC.2